MKTLLQDPQIHDAIVTGITTVIFCVGAFFKKKFDLKKLRDDGKLNDGK